VIENIGPACQAISNYQVMRFGTVEIICNKVHGKARCFILNSRVLLISSKVLSPNILTSGLVKILIFSHPIVKNLVCSSPHTTAKASPSIGGTHCMVLSWYWCCCLYGGTHHTDNTISAAVRNLGRTIAMFLK